VWLAVSAFRPQRGRRHLAGPVHRRRRRWGPPLFMICLTGGGLWLVARDTRAHGSRLKSRVSWDARRVAAPCARVRDLWSVASPPACSGCCRRWRWRPSPASIGGPLDGLPRAGIYEELLFRVLLVHRPGGRGPDPARMDPRSPPGSPRRCSARHLLGLSLYRSVRRPLQVYSFVFRMIAGLFSQACTCCGGSGSLRGRTPSTTCRCSCLS